MGCAAPTTWNAATHMYPKKSTTALSESTTKYMKNKEFHADYDIYVCVLPASQRVGYTVGRDGGPCGVGKLCWHARVQVDLQRVRRG